MYKRFSFNHLLILAFLLGSIMFVFLPTHLVHAASGKNLVLVGGNLQDNNSDVYNKIISLAGGTSTARIGVITAASIPKSQDPDAGTSKASNSYDNALYYSNLFKNTYRAVDAQWIPIDLDNISNNSSQTVVNQVNSMTGFFFGGGDQSRLITCFFKSGRTDSPVLAAIRNKYNNGAVIAGSSAGTEVAGGPPMVTGGESYDAIKNGSHTAVSTSYPDDLSYDRDGGFNFFKYGLIDAHYSQRGRQGRTIRLLSDTSNKMGYGVDEDSALVVTQADTSSAQMQVIGTGGVTIVDLSNASKGSGRDFTISGISMTYLTPGDTYDPTTKKATIANAKKALAGREKYNTPMSTSRDIFSSPNSSSSGRTHPREFVIVASDLFNSKSASTYGISYESGPAFKVTLTKSSSAGYEGYQGSTDFYSYTNLKVDISIY